MRAWMGWPLGCGMYVEPCEGCKGRFGREGLSALRYATHGEKGGVLQERDGCDM